MSIGRKIRVGSFCIAKINPTSAAIATLNPIRQKSIFPKPNAASVLAITIGFATGEASRNAIPTWGGIPLRINRRVRGATPHSHTGNPKPSRLPNSAPPIGFRGTRRIISSWLKKTSTIPEARVPSNRNGEASMKMPRNMVVKVERLSTMV